MGARGGPRDHLLRSIKAGSDTSLLCELHSIEPFRVEVDLAKREQAIRADETGSEAILGGCRCWGYSKMCGMPSGVPSNVTNQPHPDVARPRPASSSTKRGLEKLQPRHMLCFS